jgi:hypothetical protein
LILSSPIASAPPANVCDAPKGARTMHSLLVDMWHAADPPTLTAVNARVPPQWCAVAPLALGPPRRSHAWWGLDGHQRHKCELVLWLPWQKRCTTKNRESQ